MNVMLTAPILPGHGETWRRLCQELLGSRAEQLAAACRRFGVRSLHIWVLPNAHAELTVVSLDADYVSGADVALASFVASDLPFDRWLLRQIQQALGIDLVALGQHGGELVLEWFDPNGTQKPTGETRV